MKYTVTVTEDAPAQDATSLQGGSLQREIYRQAFDQLDLPRFIAALNKPAPKPRKKRSDAGATRGEK